ncbi:MAG: Tol-Pal system protein TolB, partial [Pseudomonadota bacterium]
MKFQSSALTLLAAALFVTPLAAQNQDLGDPLAEGGQVETTGTEASEAEDEGGLTFTVTDENDWQDLGVAIPAFATDQDRPTPANAQGTAALGREVANVITANLRNNGLFKPTGPRSLPQPSFDQITS